MEIRRETNIEKLMEWRREVIENVFGEVPDQKLLLANREYYRQHIPAGTHLAFIASEDGKELGCGAVCLSQELPSPDNPTGRCAYLMNIYVRTPFRCHGVAHRIVSHLIAAAKEKDCWKIYLETTDEGRPVYSSLGFDDMKDMMKLSTLHYDEPNT